MGEVVKLVDTHAGFSVDDAVALGQWGMDWCEAFRDGKYGALKSITIVVEGKNGEQASITQGLMSIDAVRSAGNLLRAAHRLIDGRGTIGEFNGDD